MKKSYEEGRMRNELPPRAYLDALIQVAKSDQEQITQNLSDPAVMAYDAVSCPALNQYFTVGDITVLVQVKQRILS